MKPRILCIDIETAPLEMFSWGLWGELGGKKMMIKDWSILAVTACWEGGKPMYRDTSKRRDPRDDKQLVTWVHSLLSKADIVVTKNGVRFDQPKIAARCMIHRLPPLPPHLSNDVEKTARKFGFTSYSLEYLCEALGIPLKKLTRREFEGIELWRACLQGNKRAWAEMRRYNVRDVACTQLLAERFKAWQTQVNQAVFTGRDVMACGHCGSEKLQSRGRSFTKTGQFRKYQCNDCSGWTTSKVNLLSKEKRKAMRG